MSAERLRPTRAATCPSSWDLDALAVGDPGDEVTRAHAETCAACRAYVTEVQAHHLAFRSAHSTGAFMESLARRPAARRWWQGPWGWVTALALASLVALIIPFAHESDDVRLKGSPFHVIVKRTTGQVEAVVNDERLEQGDTLRFSYDGAEVTHLAVLNFDGRRRATVFYPWGELSTAEVAAHRQDPLPGSIELDDGAGPEWLLAVGSPKPLRLEPLLQRLTQTPEGEEPVLACDGCVITRFRIQKGGH